MLEQKKITSEKDIDLLRSCIKNSPKGTETFRYFQNRHFSVLQKHKATFLYFKDNECVGYGHLDTEDNNVWLGVIVFDNHTGKGYGKYIVKSLINHYDGDIVLSVDKTNLSAFNIYKKLNFKVIEEHKNYYIMKISKKPMSNLIIGNTSQLSHYFPKNYEKISSRDINFDVLKTKNYNRIFLLFAEQRTFLKNDSDEFNKINFNYTLKVIDNVLDICKNVVIYSTSELWNKYNGKISISHPFKYYSTPYIESKKKLCNFIYDNRDKYQKVIIVYPFNFNSVYRKEGFLFKKIFDSIITDKKIDIGDVDFYRDLIHPKIIADVSIQTECDVIVGSGELINVKTFIKDLYTLHNKNFDEYITIDNKHNLKNKRSDYYNSVKYSSYKELLDLSLKDLYEYKIS